MFEAYICKQKFNILIKASKTMLDLFKMTINMIIYYNQYSPNDIKDSVQRFESAYKTYESILKQFGH